MYSTENSIPKRTFFPLLLVGLILAACSSGPAPVQYDPISRETRIPSYGGQKRVVIDKSTQTLRAYDEGRLVFETRISTGREGRRTPDGTYSAEMKDPMHYSSLYGDAPMPYSVQFSGDYFIHGYKVVPLRPASHGCIRLPLQAGARNPARMFYNWVEPGTPIIVKGRWQA